MDSKIQKVGSQPYYQKIYHDIILKKCPEKYNQCSSFLNKNELTNLEIIRLDSIIFDKISKETEKFNQMHKSYDKETILKILQYQKNNKLNNTQLSLHFKLSRNTIAKWKNIFNNELAKL